MAFPRVRPACSTMPSKDRRVCSVAASSKARSRRRTFRSCGRRAWCPAPNVCEHPWGHQTGPRGRRASIATAERIGGRILDVGIGTGISLTDYAPKHRIVGVDYCEPMLRKAHERVAEYNLAHVEALAVMDAQHLGFPDAFFDAVGAQFVITTVPDPEAALDEFARVTKAGGEIILVNHLGADAGPRRVFEQSFAPVARRLGWRVEFRWQRLARWAERHGGVRLLERRPMPPFGHFSLIRFA